MTFQIIYVESLPGPPHLVICRIASTVAIGAFATAPYDATFLEHTSLSVSNGSKADDSSGGDWVL